MSFAENSEFLDIQNGLIEDDRLCLILINKCVSTVDFQSQDVMKDYDYNIYDPVLISIKDPSTVPTLFPAISMINALPIETILLVCSPPETLK
jgi:hypothetical protein